LLNGLADVHVVFAITQALRLRNMDVVTAQERDLATANDDQLLLIALSERRVMLTNDTDFLALAAQLSADNKTFAPIYFWPQQQRSIGEIMRSIIHEASSEDYETACSRVHFM
jgi:hypothetical protein